MVNRSGHVHPRRARVQVQCAMLIALLVLGSADIRLGGSAYAHEVQPIRIFLNVGEGQREGVINIRNTRDKALPVEIAVFRRIVSEDGAQNLVPADDDFLVFPPQMLVAQGSSQSVRFQYIGDPRISESISYIIEAQEVPVVPDGFTGIVTVYNVGSAVYMQPARPRAELAISNIQRDGDVVRFEVRNTGNDYSFLTLIALELIFGTEKFTLEAETVNEIIRNPIVPPNSLRRFEMDVSRFPDGTPEIRFGRV